MTSNEKNSTENQNTSEDSAEQTEQEMEMKVEQETGGGADVDVEALRHALQAAEDKVKSHWDQVLRTKAEMENLRRRTARELEDAHKFALERFLQELLPVRDSMELGAAAETDDIVSLKEGMDLTLKMLAAAMEKSGVEVIEPARGEKMDPEKHQAMLLQVDTELPPNSILTVMQKGYLLNSRLARPAMVVVSRADDEKAGSKDEEQGEKA